MISSLAQSIRARRVPDMDSAGLLAALAHEPLSAPDPPDARPLAPPTPGRYPALPGPIEQIRRQGTYQGRTRQQQGYNLHEVMHEYISLRRHIFATLRDELPEVHSEALNVTLCVDRLLDEALLATVKSYHEAVIADLKHRAVRDLMTGLYNHEYFYDRLQEEVRRAGRQSAALSLLMLDVDLLKQVNDTYGHAGGDRLLQTVADALRTQTRDTDLACRYGGDEFAVILPTTNRNQAERLIERIHTALSEAIVLPVTLFPQSWPEADAGEAPDEPIVHYIYPSVSIGVATYPTDARNAETLIAQADAAMYRDKLARRTRRVS
jgi:diguanylate cyclase (GGDEF)-like protein